MRWLKNIDIDINTVMTILVTGVVLAVAINSCSNQKSKYQELLEMNRAIADTLAITRNQLNQEVAKISIIESEKISTFLQLETADKKVQELQSLVEEQKIKIKAGGSVTIIENTTTIRDTFEVTVVRNSVVYVDKDRDTIPRSNNPIYLFDVNKEEWITGTGKVSDTEAILALKVKNKYSLVLGSESQGWFKPRKTFAEITNHNPYSVTETLRTYQVTQKKPRKISVGLHLGYDVISKSVTLGPSLNYSLFNL